MLRTFRFLVIINFFFFYAALGVHFILLYFFDINSIVIFFSIVVKWSFFIFLFFLLSLFFHFFISFIIFIFHSDEGTFMRSLLILNLILIMFFLHFRIHYCISNLKWGEVCFQVYFFGFFFTLNFLTDIKIEHLFLDFIIYCYMIFFRQDFDFLII